MRILFKLFFIAIAVAFLFSCRSSKNLENKNVIKDSITTIKDTSNGSSTIESATNVQSAQKDSAFAAALNIKQQENITFLQHVQSNEIDATSISSNIDITINTGGKDVSVAGKLYMKKDDVIRIQITPFGLMEVARLEFTKDYVLIVNRLQKEYVKENYKQVSFLKENGLDFYALQALLWNKLYVPGSVNVTKSQLKEFIVSDISSTTSKSIQLKCGHFTYKWKANTHSAFLENVNVRYYASKATNTNASCEYSNFLPAFNSKKFPQHIRLQTKGSMQFLLDMILNKIKYNETKEERTNISEKYQKLSLEEALNKLSSF